jgi:hypothetical protein
LDRRPFEKPRPYLFFATTAVRDRKNRTLYLLQLRVLGLGLLQDRDVTVGVLALLEKSS